MFFSSSRNSVSFGSPGVVHLHGRDAEPLLVDLRRVRRVGARHAPAHVGLVADGRGERQPLALVEDGLQDEHVGDVHPALERIVQAVDVARPHAVAEAGDRRRQRVGERGQMGGQGQALRDGPPLAVAEGGRVVHVVLEHAGVRRAQHGQGHLVGDRQQRVLEQLEPDRIARRAHGPPLPDALRVIASSQLDGDVAVAVEDRARAGRHHARGVVLLDDARALARRGEVGAVEDRRLAPAEHGPEVHAARRRIAAPRAVDADPLGNARTIGDALGHHAKADDLDRLVGPGTVAVGPLVLLAEGLARAVSVPASIGPSGTGTVSSNDWP